MKNKKDVVLSIIGLLTLFIGAIIVIVMKWPAGLLVILPSAIPHIVRLYDLKKK